MAGSRIKGITIDIDGNTTGLQSSLKEVNSQTSKTSAELRDVNKLLKLDPGNVELVAQKQKLLSNAVQTTSQKLDQLKSAQSQVEAQFKAGDIGEEQYRGFQREVQATEAQLGRLKTGLQDTTNYLEGSGDAAANAEAGFKQANKAMDEMSETSSSFEGMNLNETLQGVSDKAQELGGSVIETAMDFANAQNRMQTSMGMTDAEAKRAMGSVKSVFKSGLVDSVDEANEAVMTVKNSFQDLNGQKLTDLTTTLTAIAKHGGVDIEDAVNASSQTMKAFGITGKQSTDIVAKGLQLGLDKNHDFLDTMNEYAPTFQDAGLTANQMLSVMNAGMKNGAFNTDKAADAVKEFQLRLTSGQLDEPMQQFGQATQDVFQKFKDGQATSAEVMAAVGKDLKGMPADQAKAAVQGLGTQFEDLGQKSSAALLEATNETIKATGAAKKMSELSPGEKWQGAINSLKTSFSELADSMVPIVDALSDLIKWISNLPQPMKTVIGVIGAAAAAFAALAPSILAVTTIVGQLGGITKVVEGIKGAVSGLGAALTSPLGLVVIAIAAVVTALTLFFTKTETGKQVWQDLVSFFQTTVMPIFQQIGQTLLEVWNKAQPGLQALWSVVQSIFGQIAGIVMSVMTGIASFITNNWSTIQMVIGTVLTAISAIIAIGMTAWQTIIMPIIQTIVNIISIAWDTISGVISGALNIIQGVINVVMGIINGNWSQAWEGIKGIVSGAFDIIGSIVSGALTGLVAIINGVLNVIKGGFQTIWETIKGVFSTALAAILAIVTSVLNTVLGVIKSVMNNAKSAVSSITNAIKSAFSGNFEPLKGIVSGVFNGVLNSIKNALGNAWDFASGIISRIKGLFNFSLKFPSISIPHIPLPHFSLSGSFNPLKGQIPMIGVNWYAKGGIFTKPTLFAANGGYNGVGEAGPEAALPLNDKTLGGIGKGIVDALGGEFGGTQIVIQVNADTTTATINKIRDAVMDGITRSQAAKARVTGA